jgi:hypothetical protein
VPFEMCVKTTLTATAIATTESAAASGAQRRNTRTTSAGVTLLAAHRFRKPRLTSTA